MQRAMVLIAIVTSALSASSWAQPVETWMPTSDNAQELGTVRFLPTRITMKGGMSLNIQEAGSTAFKTDWGPTVRATVYKVTGQTTPRGMTNLCGHSNVAFVLISRPPPIGSDISPREIDAFKGTRFAADSPDYCGRVSFDAGKH